MITARFRRLELIFGVPADALTHDHLKSVVSRANTSEAVREDYDLDFKETLYSNRDEDKHRLAEDVAAFANTRGGIIVIGVRADKQTAAATELTPVELSDAERLRMQHILAANVAPVPPFDIKLVPADETRGFYILVVPASPAAPHAVRAANMSLRYYRRDGSGNRPLSESEVADLYRQRFSRSASQQDRLRSVWQDGLREIDPDSQEDPWLALAIAPEWPGSMEVTGRSLREFTQQWLTRFSSGFYGDAPFVHTDPEVTTGVSRLRISTHRDKATGRPGFGYGEVHTDGCGFVGIPIHTPEENRETNGRILNDEMLFLCESGMLNLLAEHATANCGARGDALAMTGLLSPPGDLVLGTDRFHGMWRPLRESQKVRAIPALPVHSVSLDALTNDPVDRIVTTRMLLSDLFHAFGVPEVRQVTRRGEFRTQYWDPRALDNWKSTRHVPRVDTTPEQETD